MTTPQDLHTLPSFKLRFARPTSQLQRVVEQYCHGLSLTVLSRFDDHDGYDGVILGRPGAPYHFEFTEEKGCEAPRCPSPELLLVLYIAEASVWEVTVVRMGEAGFVTVVAHNPYWERNGRTFEDVDGYRVVIAQQDWTL